MNFQTRVIHYAVVTIVLLTVVALGAHLFAEAVGSAFASVSHVVNQVRLP